MNLEKKKPTDLTNEEIYALMEEMVKSVLFKKQIASRILEPEDLTHDVLTYLIDKSKRGKIGLEEIKQYPMKHFINILYREITNRINYILRKPKVQRFLNDTISLEESIKGKEDTFYTLGEVIEGFSGIAEFEADEYAEILINKFSDTVIKDNINIVLNINNKTCSLTFTYKNIARAYFNLFKDKKLTSKSFENIFIDKNTKHTLPDKEIKKELTNFRKYVKQNNILGGELI